MIDYQSIAIEELNKDFDGDDYSEGLAVDDENFDAALKSDMSDVLLKALEKLSRRQQELCHLIRKEGLSMREVSKKLNIPRGTLFDEILRIREVFRNEGLKDYLP